MEMTRSPGSGRRFCGAFSGIGVLLANFEKLRNFAREDPGQVAGFSGVLDDWWKPLEE